VTKKRAASSHGSETLHVIPEPPSVADDKRVRTPQENRVIRLRAARHGVV